MNRTTITSLAMIAALSGLSCGEDDGEGNDALLETDGVDASPTRIEYIAEQYCDSRAQCSPESLTEEYGSAEGCKQSMREEFGDLPNDECRDSLLDFFGCMSELSCDDGPTSEAFVACEALDDPAYERFCDFDS